MKKLIASIAAGAAMLAGAATVAADGKEVYSKACAVCHTVLPPKFGDKAAWAPRIASGTDALVASVIKGKGAMLPRAGNSALSDADIRAAVEYIVSQAGAAAVAADGKEIYSKACAVCHTVLPPKFGDKAAWAPRIASGTDALVASVIKGKGAMLPRAGNSALSDADIRAAVEYIVSQSRQP